MGFFKHNPLRNFAFLTERVTIFAKVLLPLPVPNAYTYRVPQEWNELLEIGQRVTVQFGPKKIYAGIVLDFSDEPPLHYQASYLLEILDDEPVVSPLQLKFWSWISQYYMCHLGEVMAAALPAGFRLQSETIIALSPDYDEEHKVELDEKEWAIVNLLIQKKQIRIDEAASAAGIKSPMKYIKSLYSRGMILMQEEVKENYKPKTEVFLKLSTDWNDESFARETLGQLEKRAPKQAGVVMAIMGMGKGEFSRKELVDKHGIDGSHIKALEKKGLVLLEVREVDRIIRGVGSKEFDLTPAQKVCCDKIESAFGDHKNVLLHGETGSGKTFVYQHFIANTLAAGKQVLYLVPEVGLTEQLVARLSAFFGAEMGVWHNFYSGAERTELYLKVKTGSIKLLVGARSALFAPFENLGLVVVDEEHENSFKQFDKRPHYHGRDAALQLASMCNCPVLMGSATPSYEWLHAAEEGKLAWINLKERFIQTPPPKVEIVNVGEAKRQNRMKQIFSTHMLESMQKTLDEKGQIIVFQNRKGYVPYMSCNFCGHTGHCINCDIALTYYKSLKTQKCNYCGFTQDPPAQCPACGSTSISMRGFGTERIAEELGIFFPEARITRFDQESVRRRSDFQKILNGFERGEIDFLVGTQLLSKGLDFENVGLVCIPDADMMLNIPDFRSHERAFQQMYQVIGRAGRGNKQGKGIVQSYQPSHPVLQAVQHSEYLALAEEEIAMRKELQYPPFARLIRVVVRHKDPQVAENASYAYANAIKKSLKERVIGPQAPVVSKIRNYYLHHILIKANPETDLIPKIKQFLMDASLALHKTDSYKGVWVDFDVDPT